MKAIKTFLTVSVLAAAGAANAATAAYNFSGWGSTVLNSAGITLVEQSITGTGTVDVTTLSYYEDYYYDGDYYDGGAYIETSDFNSGTFNYTMHVTSSMDPELHGIITGTYTIDSNGVYTDIHTSCTDAGTTLTCSPVVLNVIMGGFASSFNFSDLASLTWTTETSATTPIANATTTINYAASPVPVPAAAWLFGSTLLGMAGAARRRKAR